MRRGAQARVIFYQKPISPLICASKGSSAPLGPSPPTNREEKTNLSSVGPSLPAAGTPEFPHRLLPCVPPAPCPASPAPGDIFCLHSARFSAQEEVSGSGRVAQGCWHAQGQGVDLTVWCTGLTLGWKEHLPGMCCQNPPAHSSWLDLLPSGQALCHYSRFSSARALFPCGFISFYLSPLFFFFPWCLKRGLSRRVLPSWFSFPCKATECAWFWQSSWESWCRFNQNAAAGAARFGCHGDFPEAANGILVGLSPLKVSHKWVDVARGDTG